MAIYFADLSNYNERELRTGARLLAAYCQYGVPFFESGRLFGLMLDDVSRQVSLVDVLDNKAMFNGKTLDEFLTCHTCGHGGFREDFSKTSPCRMCQWIARTRGG